MKLNAPTPELLQQLRSLAGEQGFLEAHNDIESYLVDHRRLYRGATPLVLRPNSTEQVANILKLCNQYAIGVVPVGGNTSYCGGATPSSDGSQIVLSLARMKQLRQIDPLNYTMTVEAGCVLSSVQCFAEEHQRLFPLSLGSEGSCQIGGNLSTNAGGTAVLRYGMARDLVLGLEVVLADGSVLNELSGLRKNNAGYDLRDVFIGAEGTLGVITAATLKLYPLPRTYVTFLVAVDDPGAAVELLARMRDASGDSLSTFELMPRSALDLVFKHIEGLSDPLHHAHPWYVLLEATSSQIDTRFSDNMISALTAAQESGAIRDATLAQNETQRALLWRMRETIPEAQTRAGGSIKHDVSVAISDIPHFIAEGTKLCQRLAPEGVMVVYGHLGDGSLHFNVNSPAQATPEQRSAFFAKAPELNRAMHDFTQAYGGSISAEHGIGQLKREALAHYKDPVALQTMLAIKRALDPRGIMNPNKVVSIDN